MTFEVGDYQATELLAAGASAQVWLGRRLTTGEPVALKVFPPDQLAAVRREAALAAAVDHPHVVTVLDVVADEHRVALVTEHAPGGDLADLLARRGRLTPGQTLTVLIPLAAALATAHERQVVHGDVSAGNIVFDRAGRPLLADLGAARAAMESGRPVQATPCDAAPELARAGAPTPATDLFSLGSVALACLTGRPAWPADDLRDVVIQAAAGQWPDLPDDAAPPPLVAAVRSLLEHDPDRRPGAASLVLDLRSAGRPEPLDVSAGRRNGGGLRSTGPAQERGRHPSHPRHGRVDDDFPAADDAPVAPWLATGPAHPGGEPSRDRPDVWAPGRARALTRARPDATPAGATGTTPDGGRWDRIPGLRGRASRAAAGHSRRALRVTALTVVGVVLAVLAGLVGLGWAASGRADPVAVHQLAPVSAPAGPGQQPTATASRSAAAGRAIPSTRRSAVAPTAAPTIRSGPSGPPGPSGTASPSAPTRQAQATTAAVSRLPDPTTGVTQPARTANWTATVQGLDRARSKALVARDPALLDAVYTPHSAARSADAQTIRTLVAEGLRVSGAQHEVQSVQPMTGATATVVVRDSLPSYEVLSATGSVVGRTPERAAAPRVMVLVDTAAGYRISEVRAP